MNWLKRLVLLVSCFSLTACGIYESYYLPQISATNVSSNLFSATVTIPTIDTSDYYYALGYSIFYRIYTSGHYTEAAVINESDRNDISTSLRNDYRSLASYESSSNTSFPISTTFSGLKYYMLELNSNTRIPLEATVATLEIDFPSSAGEPPSAKYTLGGVSADRTMTRSGRANPSYSYYFFNNDELSTSGPDYDLDVEGTNTSYSYVSMYIVLAGQNYDTFTPIYGKPTHIGIFKLTD